MNRILTRIIALWVAIAFPGLAQSVASSDPQGGDGLSDPVEYLHSAAAVSHCLSG
jgi:hypothetical protein